MSTVELFETQLAFLDRAIAQRGHDETREQALREILTAHVQQRLTGEASPYVGGATDYDELTSPAPRYGPARLTHTIQPVGGKAVPVRRGEILRIQQVEGGTCVDFNAYNFADYKEALDCGFTRSGQSFDPRRGEFIWTNAPRGRPIFAILEIADTCELDITGHRCNRMYQDLGWGLTDHVNCQDSLAEAIREYGLTPDDVHDSFNLWMATTIDEQGRRQFRWNPGAKGDHIDLLAIFDVLAAAVICGSGELVGISNYTFQPIEIEIFEASDDTKRLVDRVEERWTGRPSQVTTADLSSVPIHAERALRRDPDYVPAYRPEPARVTIEVPLSDDERKLTSALISTGVYGSSEGEAVRAAFMRWCNSNVTRFQRARIAFN